MAGFKKTPKEKLRTKLNNIVYEPLEEVDGKIKLGDDVFFSFNDDEVSYSKKRYYPNSIINVSEDDFEVKIPLSHENLKYISSTNPNPPKFSRGLIQLLKDLTGEEVNTIIIGADNNSLENSNLYVTSTIYDDYVKIYREEGTKKVVRVKNRIRPFLNQNYNLNIQEVEEDKDYNLMLREVINSGKVDQQDIIALSAELEEGNHTQVVIERQVNKQVKWLIETIEKILEEDTLTKPRAQEFGKIHFGYFKKDISGPEHLMEKILAQYGQSTLFGVPALLNTDKYVQHDGDLSRSQFDLILITHLGDVEVVELKRPDEFLLKCDFSRKKFYPTKDLSIAVSQCERYITTVLKDNDDEYKIRGKKIREYLNDEVGGTMFIETVRPKALIIIGSYKTLYKPYDELIASNQAKIAKETYEKNGDRAYAEIKGSFKNINILTYSELLEHARTRLELSKDEDQLKAEEQLEA